jgi:hypothetical protein
MYNHAFMFHATASLDWANFDNERFSNIPRAGVRLSSLESGQLCFGSSNEHLLKFSTFEATLCLSYMYRQ